MCVLFDVLIEIRKNVAYEVKKFRLKQNGADENPDQKRTGYKIV